MRQRVLAGLSSGAFGDADCNNRVNLVDLRLFSDCVTGPTRRLNLGCEAFDADLDGNVDLADFAAFQPVFDATQ